MSAAPDARPGILVLGFSVACCQEAHSLCTEFLCRCDCHILPKIEDALILEARAELALRFNRPERAGQLLREAAQLAAYCRV